VKDDSNFQRRLLRAVAQHAARQGQTVGRYLENLEAATMRQTQRERKHPSQLPATGRAKYVVLTRREIARLFTQIGAERDRALFGAMYFLGLRASEVGLLLREHVSADSSRIYVPRLNGGVAGDRPVSPELLQLLQAYMRTREDSLPYLFPSRNSRPMSRQRIDRLFRSYATEARLPPQKHHSHCLRHSVAVHLIEDGYPLEEVQMHLGHKSINSTVVYIQVLRDSPQVRTRQTKRLNAVKPVLHIVRKYRRS